METVVKQDDRPEYGPSPVEGIVVAVRHHEALVAWHTRLCAAYRLTRDDMRKLGEVAA